MNKIPELLPITDIRMDDFKDCECNLTAEEIYTAKHFIYIMLEIETRKYINLGEESYLILNLIRPLMEAKEREQKIKYHIKEAIDFAKTGDCEKYYSKQIQCLENILKLYEEGETNDTCELMGNDGS